MISIKVYGLPKVIKGFKNLGQEQIWYNIVQQTAEQAYANAKEMVAVDTGALEKSIYYKEKKKSFEIGATAPHAIYNEYGSYNIPDGPRVSKSGKLAHTPFLRPAAYKAMREVAPREFKKTVDTAFK